MSLKITLSVWANCSSDCCPMAICKAAGLPTLLHATYNCPWLNTGVRSQSLTCFSVCPWDLLTVVENATRTGNCNLVHSKSYIPGSVMYVPIYFLFVYFCLCVYEITFISQICPLFLVKKAKTLVAPFQNIPNKIYKI